jgi:ferredoxin
MNKITAKEIKNHAKKCGADIVGITTLDRFEGLPKQMDPREIFPEAKSMIVMGFRIFRGVYRGIEEGTFFAAYSIMGYEGTRWVFQPVTLWNFTKLLENEGYEAVPIPDNFPWSNLDRLNPDDIGTDFINVNQSEYGKPSGTFSRPVAPDKPLPDVFVQLKIAAYCAGLGEIGYSGQFLTPEFGPRQMFAAILTDAVLDPDPIFTGKICDQCLECVKECPAQAISKDEMVKVKVGGRELKWAKLDFKKCSVAFYGGIKEYNPFMVSEKDELGFSEQPYTKSMRYKIAPAFWYGRSLEGKRGCHMACMIHLEKQGKIKNVFQAPFRRKTPWKLSQALKDLPPENAAKHKIDEQ